MDKKQQEIERLRKQEIDRLRKKAKPYIDTVKSLFKEEENHLESALKCLIQNDSRSAILQCEMIVKQLLNDYYFKKTGKQLSHDQLLDNKILSEFEELTKVQIKYILTTSNNLYTIDFETAIFTFNNLLQILEEYKPGSNKKYNINLEIDCIRQKLEHHQEFVDSFFPDNPLENVLELSKNPKKYYIVCIEQIRYILEKILHKMNISVFNEETEKQTIFEMIHNKKFMLHYKQHFHTLDAIRRVGNWGAHPQEFPLNEKYCLFAMHSLYIILELYINIHPHNPPLKKRLKSFIVGILLVLLIFLAGYFYLLNYFNDIKNGNCTEAIQKLKILKKLKIFKNEDKIWLDFCLLKTECSDIEELNKSQSDYENKIKDYEKYKLIYDSFIIISSGQKKYPNIEKKELKELIEFFMKYLPKEDNPEIILKDIKERIK